MPFFSLEEAVDCPPALIGDSSKGTNDNIQFCKNGASPSSGKITKGTKLNSEKNSESEARNESVLSRWSDRASIQSFMNAISTLSAKKQQMEFQQQQQNKEIFDKFRLFMQQQQLERNQDQKTQQKQQQQQQQQQQILTLNPLQQQQPILTLNTLQQQQQQTPLLEQNVTNALVQTKPKVRKVMKGGVLVSMPVSVRHPPGGNGIEHSPRGESGPVTNHDKGVGFGSGNILDDILARSQGSKETSVVARKKVVISKTIADKGKGKQAAGHKTGETVTTNELWSRPSIDNENIMLNDSSDSKNIHKTGEAANALRRSVRNGHAITVSDSSDGKNININLSLTISMPGHEQQKAEIKHTTTIKKPSLAQTDNIVLDGSGSFVERSNVVESSNDEEQPMGSMSELDGWSGVRALPINVGRGTAPQNPFTDTESCVLGAQLKKPKLDPDASEQRKIQPIVISDTDNEEQGILINQTELNSKLDTATVANPGNDQAISLNMNQSESNSQPEYITLSSPENSHSTASISCISDTDNQNNVKASKLISVDRVTKATPGKSSNTSNMNSKPADNDGQSNGKVSKHLVDKLDNEISRHTHTPNTDRESNRTPSSLPRLDNDVQMTSPDTRKQDNATQLKVDIKSDPAVTSHGSSDVFKQGNTTQTKVNIKPDPVVFSHGSSHILKEGNLTQGKINFKPDPAVTSPAFSGIVKQENITQARIDIKPEPVTVRVSNSHDLVSKDINGKGRMNLPATYKQSNVNESKTDIKPDIITLNPESSKQGNANRFVTAIKPDFVSINTDSSKTAKQDNDSKQEPTTVSPASSDLVVAIDIDAGGQRPSQSSPRQHNDMLENSQVNSLDTNNQSNKDQFKIDIKQSPVPQSPGSPSGDLFIDMDSDTEMSTRSTRRAKKRERYSSLTSESSSEEQKVSSFDWIRNLSEKLSNCVKKNMEEGMVSSSSLSTSSPSSPYNHHHHHHYYHRHYHHHGHHHHHHH
jgi:hypothetical protein